MRVRIHRPRYQRRARYLLAIAFMLPAAGFVQAAGYNPVTVGALVMCLVGAVLVAYDTARAVLVVIRQGILIRGALGRRAVTLSWSEIVRVDAADAVVSITTTGNRMYQIHVDSRAALFLSRMMQYTLAARR